MNRHWAKQNCQTLSHELYYGIEQNRDFQTQISELKTVSVKSIRDRISSGSYKLQVVSTIERDLTPNSWMMPPVLRSLFEREAKLQHAPIVMVTSHNLDTNGQP
jgi:hypothetical protein